ncbi:BON domain-containing protein [Deinococcus oregonensis]|uniref:BON domain-containing protein n=1 Tax=Deinococcus oregonensis TaxID=1805970 RepID=A0ABV6AUM8_9DEIO
MKPNETLQLHVVQQLEWNPSVDASNIGVQVQDGVVTLEGHVTSYAEKFAAVRVTKAVSGVKGLADELQVKLHTSFERTDTDLVTFALQMLNWDTVVPKDHVRVTVRDGWLTLEGEVDWDYQRTGAERAIQYLSGIKGVSNAITLTHCDLPTDVKTKIELALQRSAVSDAQHISVEMHGGTATLSGEVHTFAARDEAALAAWGAPGVRSVTNHITVATDFSMG